MRFTAPEYLILLPLLAWFWRAGTRPISGGARSGRRRRVGVRCLVAALLIAALAGPQVVAGQAPLSVMFLLDVSGSMAAAQSEAHRRLDAFITRLRPDDRAGLIVFGAAPVVERAVGTPAPIARTMSADVSASATDIEAALRLARTALPPEGARRIVLLSDGHETLGDAMREASFVAGDDVAVDVAVPRAQERRLPVVSHVAAPPAVAAGEPFAITAVAEGPPGDRAELVILGERQEILRQDVRFSADGLATATQIVRMSEPGVYVYRARVESDRDLFAGSIEASAGAVVTVSGEPRVLYVGNAPAQLAGVLRPAFTVDSVTPAGLAGAASSLASYGAVILDDVGPDMLTDAHVSALLQSVEARGSGLLVLGSARSLDATLVPEAGLGRLLPVDLRPRAGVRAPELALVVVFDKSGSMDDRIGGAAKIEFARQGVQRVLSAVPATDAVGVIAFNNTPETVASLQVGLDAATVANRLREIEPAGGTAMAPAVRLALEWLSSPELARVSRRHILLVSDGLSSDSDIRNVQLLVGAGNVQLSVISLGGDRSRRILTTLAEATGGRAYFPDDARELPLVVAREAARVAGGRTVEESFLPRLLPHPISSGIEPGALPPLTGYVVSAARPAAAVALSSHRDDPILAAWRFGLGRVAVYTADLQSDWSARLRESPVYASLMLQTVRWLSRPVNDGLLYSRFEDRGDHVQMIVDAHTAATGYLSLLDSQMSVRKPSGDIEQIPLMESLPGRYEGRIATADAGAYIVSVSAQSDTGRFEQQALRGFYWSGGSERRGRGVNRALLAGLAQATGGAVLDSGTALDGDNPFAERPQAYRDLRRWLLGAAFLLFLAELVAPAIAALTTRRRGGQEIAERGAAA